MRYRDNVLAAVAPRLRHVATKPPPRERRHRWAPTVSLIHRAVSSSYSPHGYVTVTSSTSPLDLRPSAESSDSVDSADLTRTRHQAEYAQPLVSHLLPSRHDQPRLISPLRHPAASTFRSQFRRLETTLK